MKHKAYARPIRAISSRRPWRCNISSHTLARIPFLLAHASRMSCCFSVSAKTTYAKSYSNDLCITGGALPVQDFSAGLPQPVCKLLSYLLGRHGIEHRLQSSMIRHLAERLPLLASIRQAHAMRRSFLRIQPRHNSTGLRCGDFGRQSQKTMRLAR